MKNWKCGLFGCKNIDYDTQSAKMIFEDGCTYTVYHKRRVCHRCYVGEIVFEGAVYDATSKIKEMIVDE